MIPGSGQMVDCDIKGSCKLLSFHIDMVRSMVEKRKNELPSATSWDDCPEADLIEALVRSTFQDAYHLIRVLAMAAEELRIESSSLKAIIFSFLINTRRFLFVKNTKTRV